MATRFVVENCIIFVCTTACVLGLYAMGAGYSSFFGFVLLAGMNTPNKANK